MLVTVETLYLGPSLTTEPFLNHATMGTGLPLCEHVKTASEPRVTTRLGVVTEVIVGIAVGKTTSNDNSNVSVTDMINSINNLYPSAAKTRAMFPYIYDTFR